MMMMAQEGRRGDEIACFIDALTWIQVIPAWLSIPSLSPFASPLESSTCVCLGGSHRKNVSCVIQATTAILRTHVSLPLSHVIFFVRDSM